MTDFSLSYYVSQKYTIYRKVSGEKMPAYNATFLNSLMIRALDFNDIYWKQDPSPPSDIIPAALAVGEWGREKRERCDHRHRAGV